MLYTTTLALHLALTITTGLIGLAGVYALVRGSVGLCKRVAIFLAIVVVLEVFSGTVLAIISPNVEAVTLGSHIALYIGVCAALEAALVVRMKRVALYAASF